MGWIARRRSRRDARAAQELAAFQSFAAANGASIVAVDSIYQVGRRGSKAMVRTGSSPFQRDAWFWWTRVRPGSLAAVYMGEGMGIPQWSRERPLYRKPFRPRRSGDRRRGHVRPSIALRGQFG